MGDETRLAGELVEPIEGFSEDKEINVVLRVCGKNWLRRAFEVLMEPSRLAQQRYARLGLPAKNMHGPARRTSNR